MRTFDTIILGEAYSKIRTIEEAKFRDIAAAAALGLSGLTGAHATTADDQADTHGLNPPIVQQATKEEPTETNYHKAKVAYDKAVKEKKADIETLKNISLDTDYAKRYAGHLVLMGHDVPDIIRDAAKGSAEETEKALQSQDLN
jgi:hypothetical protein